MKKKTIALQNGKGGVGKSTLSLLLADRMSRRGREIVFIDNDPQGSSTHWFLDQLNDDDYENYVSTFQRHNLLSLLEKKSSLKEVLIQLPFSEIKLIAATPEYEKAKTAFNGTPGHENLMKIRLNEIECDFQFLDTPGELSLLTNWSLSIANIIIIPIQSEMFAYKSLSLLLDKIQSAKDYLNPFIEKIYLIPNLVDLRTRSSSRAFEYLKEAYSQYMIFPDGSEEPLYIPKKAAVSNFIDEYKLHRAPDVEAVLDNILDLLEKD